MQILIILLLLLLGNLILTDSLLYAPLWLLNHLGSGGLWSSAFLLLIFLGWCLGNNYND